MKHIKTYESLIDAIFGKSSITKMADAITNFLNTIEPELKCNIKKINGKYVSGIWIISKSKKLAYLEYFNTGIEVVMFYKPELIKFFDAILRKDSIDNVTIRHNCHKEYGNEDIGSDNKGKSIEIPEYATSFIDKLTKENYDQYLLEQDINKYNI